MIQFQWDTSNMTPSLIKIANYIKKNTNQVLLSTEIEIAEAVQVSIASVSRFWRIVGYKNFKDFKTQVKAEFEVSPAQKMKNAFRKVEGHELLMYPTIEASLHHLYQTLEFITHNDFQQTIQLLNDSPKIYIHAPGPSASLGILMQYRITRYGRDISLLEKGGSELLEDLLHIKEDDVVIIFSFIHLLPEAKVILDHSKNIGFQTIVISDLLISDFSHLPTLYLFASRGELSEFHSMVAPTFLIENIIVAMGMKNREENIQRLDQLSELRQKYALELPR